MTPRHGLINSGHDRSRAAGAAERRSSPIHCAGDGDADGAEVLERAGQRRRCRRRCWCRSSWGRTPGILLTKRNAHLNKHAGQVSFPGGRIDATDADAEAAALREAEEEIALDPARVEVLGRMDDYVTGTGYRITPVLGLLPMPGLSICGRIAARGGSGVRAADRGVAGPGRRRSGGATRCAGCGGSSGSGRIPSITSGARRRRSWCIWRRSCGLRGRMLRLVELALFLLPFAAVRRLAVLGVRAGPSIRVVAAAACVAIVLAAGSDLVRAEDRAHVASATPMCRARFENGHIIAGHGGAAMIDTPALRHRSAGFLGEPPLAAVLAALPEARVVGGAVRDTLAGRPVDRRRPGDAAAA